MKFSIRFYFCRIYYYLYKNIYWLINYRHFSKEKRKNKLKYLIFQHRTPLLRKLKDVDMYLQYNKINNLIIAVSRLNGLIIKSGEYFSFWFSIGRATYTKGYKDGMVLKNGKVIPEVGGGLCQLSNLIYWITLHSPLKIIERWRHGYDVFPDADREQPFGSGATIAYPNIDLQIFNSTAQNFQLILEVSKDFLIGEWRSNCDIKYTYKIIESDHKFINNYITGYTRHNKLYKNIYFKKSGKFLKKEFITENNAIMMYNPLLENK